MISDRDVDLLNGSVSKMTRNFVSELAHLDESGVDKNLFVKFMAHVIISILKSVAEQNGDLAIVFSSLSLEFIKIFSSLSEDEVNKFLKIPELDD